MHLHKACRDGDLGRVAQLIAEGADVDAPCRDRNRTPLHWAVAHNRLQVARHLVQKGCLLDTRNYCGFTPLLTAAQDGNLNLVRLLVQSGADVGAQGHYRQNNALHIAVEKNRLNMAKVILSSGTPGCLDVRNHLGDTPMTLAAVEGHWELVRLFIQDYGADAGARSSKGFNILHHAAAGNRPDIVQIALGSGKLGIDQKTNDGKTALILAVSNHHWGVVRLLLKLGADIEVRNDDLSGFPLFRLRSNWNLLHHAACDGQRELTRDILKSGKLDIDEKTLKGKTAMLIAAEEGHWNVSKMLLQEGADATICDGENRNILHYAALNNGLYVARKVLNCGKLDVDMKTIEGDTALRLAMSQNNRDMVRLLLDAGADVNMGEDANSFKCNLLHHAARYNWPDIAKRVLEGGVVDVNKTDVCGETAIAMAAFMNNWKIVELLLASGAKVNYRNEVGGFSSLHFAVTRKKWRILPSMFSLGAYLDGPLYHTICRNQIIRKRILEDTELCTASIINKFNEDWLPSIYGKLRSAVQLPVFESLKIHPFQNVAKEIGNCVKEEIGRKGFCRVLDVTPPVLKWLCVRSLAGYLSSPKRWFPEEAGPSNKRARLH